MECDDPTGERAFAAFFAQLANGAYNTSTSTSAHEQPREESSETHTNPTANIPPSTVSPSALLQRSINAADGHISQDQTSNSEELGRSSRSSQQNLEQQQAKPHGDIGLHAFHALAEQRQRTSSSQSPSSLSRPSQPSQPSNFFVDSNAAQQRVASSSLSSKSIPTPTPPPPLPVPQHQQSSGIIFSAGHLHQALTSSSNDANATNPKARNLYTLPSPFDGSNSVAPVASDSVSSGVAFDRSDAGRNLNLRMFGLCDFRSRRRVYQL